MNVFSPSMALAARGVLTMRRVRAALLALGIGAAMVLPAHAQDGAAGTASCTTAR